MAKLKVLVFIDWYLPSYKAGGPIRSVAAIISALSGEIDFTIITSNQDSDGGEINVPVKNAWTTSPDGVRIAYCDKQGLQTVITDVLSREKFDFIYLNSMFSRDHTVRPIRILRKAGSSAKIILAPRGMLGAGALAIKKLKKKLFITYIKRNGLYDGITWHASSEQEASEIRGAMGNVNVVVATNLSLPELRNMQRVKVKGELKLVFLSRISVKKNLREAIQYVNGIRQGKVELKIYGPIEDQKYWERCKQEIGKAPANIKISYHGEVSGEKVFDALGGAHALLLPTRHENFGHVILEALAVSCPVVISDQTPWRNLHTQRAGWDLALDSKDDFYAALNELVAMDQHTYDELSQGAFQLANKYLRSAGNLCDTKKLFGLRCD